MHRRDRKLSAGIAQLADFTGQRHPDEAVKRLPLMQGRLGSAERVRSPATLYSPTNAAAVALEEPTPSARLVSVRFWRNNAKE